VTPKFLRMATSRSTPGLYTIFAIFLGLMITAFIGVGVNTFYPSPAKPFEAQMNAYGRQERAIEQGRSTNELSSAERERMRQIRDSVTILNDRAQAAREGWGRTTSIVLVAFATLVMAIAVLRADQLAVLSSGLLLGGVFTMCYGVGMILATTTSIARFVMLTVALAVTIGLGYLRFVRQAAPRARLAGVSDGSIPPSTHDDLAARLDRIEARLDAVGRAWSSSPAGAPPSWHAPHDDHHDRAPRA